MRKIKTILYPIKLESNISFDIKKKYLEESGFEVLSFKEGIKRFWDIDLINLNFFEIIHSQNAILCIIKFVFKWLLIDLFGLMNWKIVYTIHNKQGHSSRYPQLDICLMKHMLIKSDSVVVLCDETKAYISEMFGQRLYQGIVNKITKIPLVSYEGTYPACDIDLRQQWNISENEMVIMFLGGVSPYKNIEYIMKYANECNLHNIKFVIAGNGDERYIKDLQKLLEESSKDQVLFIPRYISNSEITAFLAASDLFLIPLNKRSSLNSGSCMLAFSHHRNVVCPLIGTVKELPEGLCYSYDYEREEDHYLAMKKALDKAILEFFDNRAHFDEKQEKLYQLTVSNNAVDVIKEKYKDLYISLCK